MATKTIDAAPAPPSHPQRRGGRPTRIRVEAINQAILDAARDSFLTHGYSQTTMENVAVAAGVSKGTLYARFPDKTALFGAVVKERLKAWVPREVVTESEGQSLHQSLLDFAEFALEQMGGSEIRTFSNFVLAEAQRFPEMAKIFHVTSLVYGRDVLINIIKSAAARDGVAVRDASTVATVFLEMLWGWSSFQSITGITPDAAARREAAEQRIAVLIAGRDAW